MVRIRVIFWDVFIFILVYFFLYFGGFIQKKNVKVKLFHSHLLARCPPDRPVWIRALVDVTVPCFTEAHFISLPLSFQPGVSTGTGELLGRVVWWV